MNPWKLAVPFLAAMVSASAVGCVAEVDARAPVAEHPREVVVHRAPPPPQVEVEPAPISERVWVRGHWHWNGADWTWVPGRWQARRMGYQWVPAHYEQRGRDYIYVEGHWRR